MVSFHKPILGVTIGLQSMALLGRAVKMVPKDLMGGKKPKKITPVKQSKKIVRGFTDIMVGTALIKPTAELVKGL